VAEAGTWNRRIIEEFRANGGKVGGEFEGTPLLLLTTTGVRSGQAHTVPLLYLPYGDRLIVFASNGGAETHPDWYRNIVAHPMATVEVRHKIFTATATVETGEFRAELFAQHCQEFPVFADEQRKTSRQIPAVSLRMAGQKPR
jgi:deazaflavin-dependent oxidoreductase (nitroreductase family)